MLTTTLPPQVSDTQPTVATRTPFVPPTPTLEPIEVPQEEESFYRYETVGNVRDCVTEKDLIYVIFYDEPGYMAISSDTGKILKNVNLQDNPGEIHIVDNELWISYPDAKCIRIYDKETFEEKRTIQLTRAIFSFDLYRDYLFYATAETADWVSRYDMATGEEVNFSNGFLFEADVLVNPEEQLVYVGESGTTGGIYCYNLETLELQSRYIHINYGTEYGFMSFTRSMFLVDGGVYWADFRFDAKDLSRVEARFLNEENGGMVYVDEDFVVTMKVAYYRADQTYLDGTVPWHEHSLITESGHFMLEGTKKIYLYPNKFNREKAPAATSEEN